MRYWRVVRLGGAPLVACLAALAVALLIADVGENPPPLPTAPATAVSPAPSAAVVQPAHGHSTQWSTPPIGSLITDAYDPSRCVMEHFAPRTFRIKQDMRFLCAEADPRGAALQLRVRVVQGSGGDVTDAMDEWARLGWHELAAVTILRWACCPKPLRIVLPDDQAECAPLVPVLQRLAEAFVAEADTQTALHAFEATVECLHRTRAPGYPYTSSPQSGGQVAFRKFMLRNGR